MKKIIVYLVAVILGISAGVAATLVFQITEVTDNSMLPTYEQGDKLLINKISYKNKTPKKGDVVIFFGEIFPETGEQRLMMKRVIAEEKDQVFITSGQVYVNSRVQEEPYVLSPKSSGEMEVATVPTAKFFVLGDNRGDSTDSRSEAVGFVRNEDILGKVIWKW